MYITLNNGSLRRLKARSREYVNTNLPYQRESRCHWVVWICIRRHDLWDYAALQGCIRQEMAAASRWWLHRRSGTALCFPAQPERLVCLRICWSRAFSRKKGEEEEAKEKGEKTSWGMQVVWTMRRIVFLQEGQETKTLWKPCLCIQRSSTVTPPLKKKWQQYLSKWVKKFVRVSKFEERKETFWCQCSWSTQMKSSLAWIRGISHMMMMGVCVRECVLMSRHVDIR